MHNVDLIFTYVAGFDIPEEIEYLKSLENLYVSNGGKFYFLELSADINTCIERNVTPHRMERNASKKDVEWSKANLINDTKNHKLNTQEGVYLFENHMKIDNTNLSPDEVANMFIEKYNLTPNDKEDKEYRYGV